MVDSRDLFIKEIENMGYDVATEIGIVMALVPEHDYKDPITHIALNNAAERAGYRGSRGMKMIQKGSNVLDV